MARKSLSSKKCSQTPFEKNCVILHSKLQDHYEESTSFETYCEVMSESDTVYTKDGRVVDPVFIKNAYVSDAVQLELDFGE
jgi:hypothetical protein